MPEKYRLSHYAIDVDRFRQVLRARREELGLTQLQLAGNAGVSSATVHKLEAGRLSVHLDLFIRVVDALGLPLCDLISFDGSATAEPPDPLAAKLAALVRANDQAGILELLAAHARAKVDRSPVPLRGGGKKRGGHKK